MIKIQGVSKRYDSGFEAVRNVSLTGAVPADDGVDPVVQQGCAVQHRWIQGQDSRRDAGIA